MSAWCRSTVTKKCTSSPTAYVQSGLSGETTTWMSWLEWDWADAASERNKAAQAEVTKRRKVSLFMEFVMKWIMFTIRMAKLHFLARTANQSHSPYYCLNRRYRSNIDK